MSLRPTTNSRDGQTTNVSQVTRCNAQLWSVLCAHPASALLVHVDRAQQGAAPLVHQGADVEGLVGEVVRKLKLRKNTDDKEHYERLFVSYSFWYPDKTDEEIRTMIRMLRNGECARTPKEDYIPGCPGPWGAPGYRRSWSEARGRWILGTPYSEKFSVSSW